MHQPLDKKPAHVLLADIAECPACGSPDAEQAGQASPKGSYAEGLTGLGVPVDQIHIRKCRSCGSYWRGPWASAAAFRDLYGKAAPRHPAGMRYSQMAGILPGGGKLVDRFLRRHVDSFESYGEMGCPVWGLLKYYSQPRYSLLGGLFDLGADAIVLNAAIGDLGEGFSRRLRLMRAVLGMRPRPAPSKLNFIVPSHDFFWGAGCSENGLSCADILRADTRKKPVQVMSFDAAPDKPIDVLGLYEIVDHYPAPMDVMRKLTRFARHVFIYTHAPRHGWNAVQHVINFTPKGLETLGQRAGWTRIAEYRMRDDHTDYAMLFRRIETPQ